MNLKLLERIKEHIRKEPESFGRDIYVTYNHMIRIDIASLAVIFGSDRDVFECLRRFNRDPRGVIEEEAMHILGLKQEQAKKLFNFPESQEFLPRNNEEKAEFACQRIDHMITTGE